MKQAQNLWEKVRQWAEGRPDIAGLALVGSHARGAARPDSDVDLILLVDDPAAYAAKPEWTHVFGTVETFQREDWGAVTSLRVIYAGGPEVEFGLTTVQWAALPLDPGTRRVIADGMQVLSDRSGYLVRALEEVHSGG